MKNLAEIKLAAFDVDGTLCTRKGCPKSILDGINKLKKNNIKVTVITGRGFYRLGPAFGVDYRLVVSSDIPLGLEHGGRITDINGKSIVYNQLSAYEIKSSLSIIIAQKENIKFIGYFPKKVGDRAKMFVFRKNDAKNLIHNYHTFADVKLYDHRTIFNFFNTDKPCMIMIKPKNNNTKLTDVGLLNITENEGYFYIMKKGVSKENCLNKILELTNINSDEVLVAGNGLNDLGMLKTKTKYKIFVGKEFKHKTVNIKYIKYVSSPHNLGKYLRSAKILSSSD